MALINSEITSITKAIIMIFSLRFLLAVVIFLLFVATLNHLQFIRHLVFVAFQYSPPGNIQLHKYLVFLT